MKNNFLKIGLAFFMGTLILIGCGNNTEPVTNAPKKYTINGEFIGLQDSIVYLMKAGQYLGYTFENIDSAKVVDGKFSLTGKVDFPEMYYISAGKKQPVSFFIENAEITIAKDFNDSESAKITGSAINDQLSSISSEIDSLEPSIFILALFFYLKYLINHES